MVQTLLQQLDIFTIVSIPRFLKSCANPLGKITDYAIKIEFQARGSPHAHTLIWIEDAPTYGINENQVICDFIDKYVTCEIPSSDEHLREMVLNINTLVTVENVDSVFLNLHFHSFNDSPSAKAKLILKKVYKEVEEDCTQSPETITGISQDTYLEALHYTSQSATENYLSQQLIHITFM